MGWAILRWTGSFHPEAGSLAASLYHGEGWYVIALVASVLFVVVTLHTLGGRWLRAEELLVGALVIPTGLAVAVSFVAPLGAMNLQWPVAAALLAGLGLLALRARASGWLGWAVALLLALPVIVLLAPLTELLWTTLSLAQAPALGVLVAVALWLCLPALTFLRQPNSWWLPALALVVAGGAFAVGNMTATPSAERPAPSTLLYVYEHGARSGLWVTDPDADPTTDSVAVAWAAAPAGTSFSARRDLADFGLPGERPVADAPMFPAAPPDVSVLADTTDGATRSLTLGVRSAIGAEVLRFHVVGTTRLMTINGRALSNTDGIEWLEHWGMPDSLVAVGVTTRAGAPLGLDLVEVLLRPEEVVVADVFRRQPQLAPDVNAQSDRALFRSSVAALLAAADSMARQEPSP